MAKVRRFTAMPLPILVGVTFACAITSPAPAASLTQGVPVTIAGTLTGAAVAVQVKLGASVLGTASINGLTWSFSWTPQPGNVGAQTLNATATDSSGAQALAEGRAITVVSSGTDYAALAVANGLTVVGLFRADIGLSGSQGTGLASWAPLAGTMSAITPHGSATNGIGNATAGLNGKAGLIQNGATQKGMYTAPALAAPGTANWHRYWIARQATGNSGSVRKALSETGDAYKVELAAGTVLYAYGAGPSGSPGVNPDTWQRGRISYTGADSNGEFKLGANLVTGGTGANTAPATARQFGDLLLNWEWLMYLEVTGPKANFLTFAGLADTAARTVDWTTAIEI